MCTVLFSRKSLKPKTDAKPDGHCKINARTQRKRNTLASIANVWIALISSGTFKTYSVMMAINLIGETV
jgi:hypothetical protein